MLQNKMTYLRVRNGYGVFKLSKHCRERMEQRGIGCKELKEAIRSGKVVYERRGVNKVISDNVHIIYNECSLRIYTVYKPTVNV